MPPAIDRLMAVRGLIQRGRARGRAIADDGAVCLVVAVLMAEGRDPDARPRLYAWSKGLVDGAVFEALHTELPACAQATVDPRDEAHRRALIVNALFVFNDAPQTSSADLLALVDRASARAAA